MQPSVSLNQRKDFRVSGGARQLIAGQTWHSLQ